MKNYSDVEYLRRDFLSNDDKLLILSITKRCNLRCVYCREANEWYDVLSSNSRHMDFEKSQWNSLVQFCTDNHIVEVLLTGGEPIEFPFIEEFISFLRAAHIRFSIHTNGTSMKWASVLEHLAAEGLKPNIAMSVELFDDLQQMVRGCGIPYELMDRIIEEGLHIEFKVTLHQKLYLYRDQIEAKLRFWQNKGIHSIRFQPMEQVGRTPLQESLALNPSFSTVMDELIRLKQADGVLGGMIRNSLESLQTTKSLIEHHYVEESIPRQCNIHQKILFLNTDNAVLNCKSLWSRDHIPCRGDTFSYVCCGYLN